MIRFRQSGGWVVAIAVAMASGVAAFAGSAAAAQSRKPFKIYGNTYYVGTADHAAVLVITDYGSLLIDTGPKEAAAQVAANIKELGFKLAELKAIFVSDARPEHAGGVGELQKLSGAQVYTMRPGEQKLHPILKLPTVDPREGVNVGAMPLVPQAWVAQDDQLVSIASVRVRALATPGGAPEGVSWSWDACDGSKCLPAVYAASLEPEGGAKSKDQADVQKSIAASLTRLEGAPCQLLLTPRPDDAGGLDRLVKADGKLEALKNDGACKAYVQKLREKLAKR